MRGCTHAQRIRACTHAPMHMGTAAPHCEELHDAVALRRPVDQKVAQQILVKVPVHAM